MTSLISRPRFLEKPRHLVFRGLVEAHGLWFPSAVYDENQMRQRVLAQWQQGASVWQHPNGVVLRWKTPRTLRAETAAGAVLIQRDKVLVSAPLSEHEWKEARENFVVDDVAVLHGGELTVLRGGERISTANWLDVGVWNIAQTQSLGELAAPIVAIQPIETDTRALLQIAPPDAKSREFLANWRRLNTTTTDGANFEKSGSDFGGLFGQFSQWLTPNRNAGDLGIASDFQIVGSSVFLLILALGFVVSAWNSPEEASGGVLILAVVLGLIFVLGAFARGVASPARSFGNGGSPLVLSPKIGRVLIALLALGLLPILLFNFQAAFGVVVCLAMLYYLARFSGFVAHLAGRSTRVVAEVMRPPKAKPIAIPGAAKQPSWFDEMKRRAAEALYWSKLGDAIGKKQARYLMKSLEFFERGDFENALRHAIPLGGESGLGEKFSPSLRVPTPRADFGLSLQNGQSSGSLPLGEELHERLKKIYRQAFERLKEQGKIDEAAFVLAELLFASEEAVEFLEQQGRLEVAAQMAEGRLLEPGLVVRQWWIAGNRERAIAIARLRNGFSDAIIRLEKDPKQRDEAAKLRALWGHFLASSGDFAGAVEAVWPHPQLRPLARQWLLNCIENGGPVAGKMLARGLELEPENWELWREPLREMLADESENRAPQRAMLANSIASQSSNPVLKFAARMTVRALMRDAGRGFAAMSPRTFKTLLEHAGDGALHVDAFLPEVPTKPPLSERAEPLVLKWENADRGALPLFDALQLPSGDLVVALGEAGARLVNFEGKTKAHFNQSAHELIGAPNGARALALAPRGMAKRISKFDFTNRTSRYWADVQLESYAGEFDGQKWFAAQNGKIFAFDTLSDEWKSLWDSGDVEGRVEAVELCDQIMAHVSKADPKLKPEVWTIDTLTLRLTLRRTLHPYWPEDHSHSSSTFVPMEYSSWLFTSIEQDKEGKTLGMVIRRPALQPEFYIDDKAVEIATITRERSWTALPFKDINNLWKVVLFDWADWKILARLEFHGASRVRPHFCGGDLIVVDDLGRLVVFDCVSGIVKRDLRL